MKKLFSLFLIPVFFILICLLFSYFQQDEWHSFGVMQSYGWRYITLDKNWFDLLFSDRVGSRLVMYTLFNLFHTNAFPFGLFSASLHIINSFLVGVIAFRLCKNKNIAFISSLFFLTNSVASQAYSWFGTMAGTLPSLTFSLLSLLFYLNFLDKRKYFFLLISLSFVFISFLFKESGYALLLLYPILWFLYTRKKSFLLFAKENFLVFSYAIFSTIVLVQTVLFIPGDRANYIAAKGSGFVAVFSHLIFYPFEGISQIFTPPSFVFGLAGLLTRLFFPSVPPDTSEFDILYTIKMANYVSFAFSVLLLVALYIFYKKFKEKIKKEYLLALIASFFFLVLSFLPFVVINKGDAYLDSRYYYPSLIGASIFFAVIVISLMENVNNKFKKILVTSVVVLFVYHFLTLATDLSNQRFISQERIDIIKSIINIKPTLGERTVFYVAGNSPGYYGIPELKVPFESGLGQVLMTVYNDSDINKLFREKSLSKSGDAGFLYDTLAQGYKEENGRGFGYYYDNILLEKDLSSKKFKREDIISLFYDSDTKKMERAN